MMECHCYTSHCVFVVRIAQRKQKLLIGHCILIKCWLKCATYYPSILSNWLLDKGMINLARTILASFINKKNVFLVIKNIS